MSAAPPLEQSPEIPHLTPVIGPGHTYETVTEQDQRGGINAAHDFGLVRGICGGVLTAGHDDGGHRVADHQGRWNLGN